MGKAWKSAEVQVAKYFGGMRRSRVSYSESIGDIIHPKYSIEVKYGKQIPKYCITDKYTDIWLGLAYRIWHSQATHKDRRWRTPPSYKFLDKAFEQAKRYNPTLEAIVCLKPKRFRGFLIVERREHE
jgi:hypothetical protein